MTVQYNYQYAAPAAGNTVTASDSTEILSLNPAGTLATLTINPPGQPRDGQPFTISSSQIVTALTITLLNNQTMPAKPSALAVAVGFRWVFDAPNNRWDNA